MSYSGWGQPETVMRAWHQRGSDGAAAAAPVCRARAAGAACARSSADARARSGSLLLLPRPRCHRSDRLRGGGAPVPATRGVRRARTARERCRSSCRHSDAGNKGARCLGRPDAGCAARRRSQGAVRDAGRGPRDRAWPQAWQPCSPSPLATAHWQPTAGHRTSASPEHHPHLPRGRAGPRSAPSRSDGARGHG